MKMSPVRQFLAVADLISGVNTMEGLNFIKSDVELSTLAISPLTHHKTQEVLDYTFLTVLEDILM